MNLRLYTVCFVLFSNLAFSRSSYHGHHQSNPGHGHINGAHFPNSISHQHGQHYGQGHINVGHGHINGLNGHINAGHGHMNGGHSHLNGGLSHNNEGHSFFNHGNWQPVNINQGKENQNYVLTGSTNGIKVTIPTTEITEVKFDEWKEQWWKEHLRFCGKQKTKPKFRLTRIMGGTDAIKGSWPWMISLFNKLLKQPTCAAVLISDQWALTAAHCFSGPINNKMFITARVGIYNSSSNSKESNEQTFKITTVIRNTELNLKDIPFDNDIALVKFDKPVKYSSFVQPICLPDKEKARNPLCAITGWGRYKEPKKTPDPNAWPQVLQQTRIPILPDDLCGSLYKGKITENMFCAGYNQGGVDACQGDSGGPLQCEDGERWFIRGITSWGGKTYTECAEPLQPGVYTKVSNYIDWILREIYTN